MRANATDPCSTSEERTLSLLQPRALGSCRSGGPEQQLQVRIITYEQGLKGTVLF